MYNQAETHSFSSFVLDKILHTIDEEDRNNSDKKFYAETTVNKMCKINAKCNRFDEDEPNLRLKIGTQIERKMHQDRDQVVMFFTSNPGSSGSSSSTPSSSGSSSVLLSSSSDSDTESIYRVKSLVPCSVIARDEEIFIKSKSKSRAMKLYNNLKTVKQPFSPGRKLTSFLTSLFINTKKTKSVSSQVYVNAERKRKSEQTSSCSPASSFSRSCFSKKLRNGAKRTVRFCPVSVIVDEDNRVCGNKCLHGGEDSGVTALSVPKAWKIGRSVSKKKEQEVLNMNNRVDEVLREFHLNRKLLRDFSMRKNEKDHDDSVRSSCSDLFELDHLALIGNDRYYY